MQVLGGVVEELMSVLDLDIKQNVLKRTKIGKHSDDLSQMTARLIFPRHAALSGAVMQSQARNSVARRLGAPHAKPKQSIIKMA
jgi:hypothetical protein